MQIQRLGDLAPFNTICGFEKTLSATCRHLCDFMHRGKCKTHMKSPKIVQESFSKSQYLKSHLLRWCYRKTLDATQVRFVFGIRRCGAGATICVIQLLEMYTVNSKLLFSNFDTVGKNQNSCQILSSHTFNNLCRLSPTSRQLYLDGGTVNRKKLFFSDFRFLLLSHPLFVLETIFAMTKLVTRMGGEGESTNGGIYSRDNCLSTKGIVITLQGFPLISCCICGMGSKGQSSEQNTYNKK